MSAKASDGGKTYDGCNCPDCCTHPECASLKKRAWCRHWFFLQWVPLTPLMPSEVLRELRERLKGHRFQFCGALTQTGTYKLLVWVPAPEGASWRELVLPEPDASFSELDEKRSRAWPLSCCLDALEWDVEVWVASLRKEAGRVLIGGEGLVSDLQTGARAERAVLEAARLRVEQSC